MELTLTAAFVTLLIFVLTLSYSAGKNVTRIDHLEEFKVDMKHSVETIHGHLLRIEVFMKEQ